MKFSLIFSDEELRPGGEGQRCVLGYTEGFCLEAGGSNTSSGLSMVLYKWHLTEYWLGPDTGTCADLLNPSPACGASEPEGSLWTLVPLNLGLARSSAPSWSQKTLIPCFILLVPRSSVFTSSLYLPSPGPKFRFQCDTPGPKWLSSNRVPYFQPLLPPTHKHSKSSCMPTTLNHSPRKNLQAPIVN